MLAEKSAESNPVRIVFLNDKKFVVSSLDIAQHFQKQHAHVLRDIDQICSNLPKEFNASNFGRVEYIDAKGEKRRSYSCTRDAFTLLAMGFTGPSAVAWKFKYIEAFNSLEAAVLQNQTEFAHQSGYAQGLSEARALPAAEADRKAAYLDGMREGKKLQKRQDGLNRLLKVRAYVQMGLSHREIGKILGVSRQAVTDTLARSRRAGLAA